IRTRRPAVVHANGVKAALVAVAAALGTRVPVVWVKHDFSWDGWLSRAVAWRCALVVGVSRAVLAAVPSHRARPVPTGIDVPDVDRDAARRRLAELLQGEGPFLMLVGRLHPVKGHAELLAT